MFAFRIPISESVPQYYVYDDKTYRDAATNIPISHDPGIELQFGP